MAAVAIKSRGANRTKRDNVGVHHGGRLRCGGEAKARLKTSRHNELDAERRHQFSRMMSRDCFQRGFSAEGLKELFRTGTAFWLEDTDSAVLAVLFVVPAENRSPFHNGSPKGGTIWNLCTATTARRRGHAETLLAAAIKQNHGAPMTLHVLKGNGAAIALYRKLGFRTQRSLDADVYVMQRPAYGPP